ncbi:16573_t:CDS:2 [Rhizophagus irregularis]|nr:16573_t:CDS:2 [Rhizophagus irregularis]
MSISKVVKDLKGRLDEKVCIITGGGSGIGFEASVLFAREGADVVVVDIDLKAAEATVERIKEKTGPIHVRKHAIAMKCDVSKEAEVKKVVEDTLKEFGKLDVMLNNAGIMHAHDDDALNTDEKVWDLTMDINLKGVWFGCKYAIEAFRKRKNGDTASKGAVIALSRELAIIHARENIRVNALCPGPLRTPLLMNYLDTEEKKNRRLVHIPIGRFGEPIEIANAALFLASDESTYVTGVEFKVDGGLTAAYVTPEGPCTSVPPKNFKKVSEEKN